MAELVRKKKPWTVLTSGPKRANQLVMQKASRQSNMKNMAARGSRDDWNVIVDPSGEEVDCLVKMMDNNYSILFLKLHANFIKI